MNTDNYLSQQSLNNLIWNQNSHNINPQIGYATTTSSAYTSIIDILEQRLQKIEFLLEELLKEKIALQKLKK